ncbi:MAG TPA: HAD family phosphatase [Candidatus Saccharimonadales bacterium]|nr:HAD family phosphatase [Candidatus Saccharimonadales bacterium]
MIKAVVFDMDGVLIDSVEIGFQARKKLLAKYNVDLNAIPDPQGEGHRAASLKTLLANVKNYHGIAIDHEEFALASKENLREDLEEHGAFADPGLITFLHELRQHGVTCAIVSSSLREKVDIKLEVLGIRQYFSVIVTGRDVKEHKPHPEPYIYALKKLALSSKDCVIFEDSLTGVQAARAAGCRVIGFTQYNPPKEPLPGVVMTVKSWDDINYKKLEANCA